MALIKVQMTGVNATLNQVDREYQNFLKQSAEELKTDLQKYTPVKSGNARKGWKERVNNNGFTVSNSVDYIERLENNHSPQTKGQGIVKPALRDFNRKRRT